MKKIFLFSVAAICTTLLAFVPLPPTAEVISITTPFQHEVEVCYTLPEWGNVDIQLICEETNAVAGEFKDKQGHGTHCAGIACAAGSPPGNYTLDFCYEGEHQWFHIVKE